MSEELNYESAEWREGYRAGMNDGIIKGRTYPNDEPTVTIRRAPGVMPWLADVYQDSKQRLKRLRP